MNSVCAVVVTYNRKVLLRESIECLLNQSNQDFDVLVVDNASTDNTFEYIADLIDNQHVKYENTGDNLGGSGGFNYGMKSAYQHGYKYIWLMDDDTMPKSTALEELMNADKLLNGNYGYLASNVLWTDGKPCNMNGQKIYKKWPEEAELLADGIVRTKWATFVSFFLKAETLEKVGLSFKEFFIWGDDMEFSNRISTINKLPSYMVGKSIVIHKTGSNVGSNIDKEVDASRLNRYKLAYRNECVMAREGGIKGRLYQFAKVNWHIVKVLKSGQPLKLKKIWVIVSSSCRGIFFRPKIEMVNK